MTRLVKKAERAAKAAGTDRPGVVRPARTQDLDLVAALWTLITEHHAELDPLFRMRPDAGGELRELLSALHRDPDAEILVYDCDGACPALHRADRPGAPRSCTR